MLSCHVIEIQTIALLYMYLRQTTRAKLFEDTTIGVVSYDLIW